MRELIQNLKFAWTYAKYQKANIIKFLICNVLMIGISIIIPVLSAKLIINLTDSKLTQLLFIAAIIFIVENLRNLLIWYSRYCSQRVYRETFIRMQTELGKEILKISNASLDKHGTGVFIQRLTGDTEKISDIFNMISWSGTNIITSIGIFGAVFIISKIVCLYMIIAIVSVYIIEKIRVTKWNAGDKLYRKEEEKTTSFTGEMVRGARDIKMLNAESSFINTLYDKIKTLNFKRYDMQKTNRAYNLLASFTYDLSDFLLIVLLVTLISNNHLAVATALVIYNYSGQVNGIPYYLSNFLDIVKNFNLSCSRIIEIFNGKDFKKEVFGTKHLDKIEGNFEFKNVSFSYSKKKIINDLSFKIRPNETVSFVGKSGAGKTTIFSLLCKMYDIDKGEILLDGININDLDRESIRGNITIISQNPYIFNLSIRDNLKLVKQNLTDEEMIEACKIACLDDFINELPDKYDTVIGEGGINLSGGQRQRLAIARALVQKTEIILFDEATSSLDNETQEKIQEAINNMKGEYTILIIAHRLSTVIDSDRILLIDKGRVVGEGTHKELLKNNDFYKQLYSKELEK